MARGGRTNPFLANFVARGGEGEGGVQRVDLDKWVYEALRSEWVRRASTKVAGEGAGGGEG